MGARWLCSPIRTTICFGCCRFGASPGNSSWPLIRPPKYFSTWCGVFRENAITRAGGFLHGATIDDDVYAEIFTDVRKRAPIVNVQTIKAHLRPLFTRDIRRVVTHNNWGEYGHAQHRAVNIAVRQFAVELGLDVWALGCLVKLPGDDLSDYVDVATTTGLPTIEGNFDAQLFHMIRDKYLESIPAASTTELTEKFRRWSRTLWTWCDARDAFPTGWRPFIQLVHKGSDLTLGNSAIEQLEREVTPVNECAEQPIY